MIVTNFPLLILSLDSTPHICREDTEQEQECDDDDDGLKMELACSTFGLLAPGDAAVLRFIWCNKRRHRVSVRSGIWWEGDAEEVRQSRELHLDRPNSQVETRGGNNDSVKPERSKVFPPCWNGTSQNMKRSAGKNCGRHHG